MSNILTIARTDLRIYLADRGNILGLLVMPVIMTLFLGGVFSGGGPDFIRIDVLDEDNSAQTQAFIGNLRSVNPALLICPQDQDDANRCALDELDSLDRETAVQRVQDGVTEGLLVLPAGYGAALTTQTALTLPYYAQPEISDVVRQSIEAALQRVNGSVIATRVGVGLRDVLQSANGENSLLTIFANIFQRLQGGSVTDDSAYSAAVFTQASNAWAAAPVTIDYTLTVGETSDNNGGFTQSVPGMATFFVAFSVLAVAMTSLVKQRQAGTLPRLAAMPVRRSDIIGGKILAYFTIGIIQFLIVFAVGLVVGINFGNDFIALLLLILVYTLCITALGFALVPYMRNESQVSALSTLLGMLLGALGGAWWPLDVAPPFMQTIGHLTPTGWAMDGFRQLFFFGGTLGDVLLPLGVLAVATVALFVIGIVGFKYQ